MSRNLQGVIHLFLRWMSKIDEMKHALAEAISLQFPKGSWHVATDSFIHPVYPSAHDYTTSTQGECLLSQLSEVLMNVMRPATMVGTYQV